MMAKYFFEEFDYREMNVYRYRKVLTLINSFIAALNTEKKMPLGL